MHFTTPLSLFFALAASITAQDLFETSTIDGIVIGGGAGRRTRGSCTAPVTDNNQNGGCGDILELGPSGTFLILPSTTIQNPTFTPSGGAVIEQGGNSDIFVSNDGSSGITVVNGVTVGGGAGPTGGASSAGAGSAGGSSKSGNAAPAPTRAPGFELAMAALAAGGVIAAL